MDFPGEQNSGNGDRVVQKVRKTGETEIAIRLNLDGQGRSKFDTGVPFFDHMLDHVARHSQADLEVGARGDLEIDCHHTVEDTAIVLGQALASALGDKKGIRRYGHFTLPMDEVLTTVAVDFGGRAFYKYTGPELDGHISAYDLQLTDEFLQKLSFHAAMNLHVVVHYGWNRHHIHESIFKALGRALRMAWEADPRMAGQTPSTKGVL